MITFITGTMSAGKSALLLQDAHNIEEQGLAVQIFTGAQKPVVSSRIGLQREADHLPYTGVATPDYILVDEAQFVSPVKVDGLIRLADKMKIHVRAYGLLSDFRGQIFSGTERWLALADTIETLPGVVQCWCGRKAQMNARIERGEVVYKGEQILEGDIAEDAETYYRPLCRQHWRDGHFFGGQNSDI